MFSKLKQFKDLRDQAKKIQDLLKDVTVEGTAAWNKVKITMNGSQEVTAVSIDPEVIAGGASKVESAVKDAINDAVKKSQKAMADTMRASGDFKLPGMTE